MTRDGREDGYDDLLDAVETGSGYYLACSNGHGSLPPREVCPTCGDADLSQTSLPQRGTVVTFTEVAVPTPRFAGDRPVVAIAEFGAVRLTGRVDSDHTIAIGDPVEPAVGTAPDGQRHLVFRTVDSR
jgi:uncharacterized OB-fold protein